MKVKVNRLVSLWVGLRFEISVFIGENLARETLLNFTIKPGTDIPLTPHFPPTTSFIWPFPSLQQLHLVTSETKILGTPLMPIPLRKTRIQDHTRQSRKNHLHSIHNKYLRARPTNDSTTNTSQQIYFHINHFILLAINKIYHKTILT